MSSGHSVVIAGAAAGLTVGVLIPHLHVEEGSKLQVDVQAMGPAGLSARVRF